MTLRVLVHHPVCQELDRASAECLGEPEAGGILLGAYRGPDMEVTGLTHPGPADERMLYSFTRSDLLHDMANKKIWEESGGTVSYIGEWHTHPVGKAVPSSIDVNSWKSEVRRCGRPMVFVIVAPGEWGVYVIRNKWVLLSKDRLSLKESGLIGMVFQ